MVVFNVHESWYPLFKKWHLIIDNILTEAYDGSSRIKTYPSQNLVFKAFEIDIGKIQLVIVGQDCYHGDGQAMGLCFSVPEDIKIPPSLVNIFKEIQNEFPERQYNFTNGDLTQWMERENMFLLNSALTVKQASPLSHIKKWEKFTDAVMEYIMEKNDKCIFLLLGKYAKDKTKIIQNNSRCVKGVHPSPLSAHQGFFNSGLFKEIENKIGKQINWQN